MNEITIGNKVYISSKRAAEITGYAKDYIGQLCREGRIDARLIGRNWYLFEDSIRGHRFGNMPKTDVEEPSAVEFQRGIPAVDALWDSPRYEPEAPDPIVALVNESALEATQEAHETGKNVQTQEFLSDMRSAWKEWFDVRSTEKGAVAVQATDTAILPEEAPTSSLSAPETVYEAEQQVPITILQGGDRAYGSKWNTVDEEENETGDPVEAEQSSVPTYPVLQYRPTSSLGLRLSLVFIAVMFAATALIGTGYVKINASVPVEAAALGFITGTQTIEK